MASTFEVVEKVEPASSGKTIVDDGYVTFRATRSFTITLDEGTDDDTETVLAGATGINGLPKEDDPHPRNPSLRCDDVQVDRVSVLLYEAVCTYKSIPIPQDETGGPTELPVKITWDTIRSEEEIDEDADGNPLRQDGTEEPILGVTRQVSDLVGIFEKNIVDFNPVSFYGYIDRVNSDTFLGFPIGTLRIDHISAVLQKAQGATFWALTVKIQCRKPFKTTVDKAWYKRIMRQGFYERVPGVTQSGDPIIVRAGDGAGKSVTSPVPLNANGQRLPEGSPAQWKEWRVYDSVAFASMGLL